MKEPTGLVRITTMDHRTRVLIQVIDYNDIRNIDSFTPLVTALELNMLEAINGFTEGECEDTDAELSHVCVMHFLGKPAFYSNEERFNDWMNGGPSDGCPFASEGARALLTWGNHGKWETFRKENNHCTGVTRFYHFYLQ